MRILECSSAGDKRFSAFYARVVCFGKLDSIENHYQSVKRNAKGLPCRKGERVAYVEFNGNGYVACPDSKYEPHILTDFYRYLWYKYLSDNPELVAYAKQFDKFNDMFRGKCINCQADCVEAFVKENNLFYECIKMLQNYDNQAEEMIKHIIQKEK